ncbi:MAG: hypothetical protein ACR2LK_03160 [Solirubrobacteraceae bacterium]
MAVVRSGFTPVDEHGRVQGLADVYAAGDGTTYPVKQGGLACQQADAIAELLAANAGADVNPHPFSDHPRDPTQRTVAPFQYSAAASLRRVSRASG